MILNFLPPFYHSLKQKNLTVEVVEGNLIPSWACTDWSTYKEILFHILQNAIKFNSENGKIKILVSFHTFKEEFKPVSPNKKLALLSCSYSNSQDREEPEESQRSFGSNKLKPNDTSNLFSGDEQMKSSSDTDSCKWGYLITQVSDTGEGIQPKVIKNLF